jgi:hypothetical protein
MIRVMLIAVAVLRPSVAFAQGMFDWMGRNPVRSAMVDAVDSMQAELLALRPQGKHAYIVAVCSESDLASWSNRAEVESKGWGVARMEPRIDLATSFVVIGDRMTALRSLPTNADLHQIVAKIVPKIASVRASKFSNRLKITMISRENCSWCDKWKSTEYPKAIAAGVSVEFATSGSGVVPRFEVCGADGQCRLFTGFTSFETMER